MSDQPTPAVTDETLGASADRTGGSVGPDADALVEDLLVEEVSIDGMCGVY